MIQYYFDTNDFIIEKESGNESEDILSW
jgi:hypothetical protein